MAYFMDRYDFDGGTAGTDVAAAHSHDLEVQQQYGVTYCSYWFDYERQSAFCLIDAPSAEAAAAVHRARGRNAMRPRRSRRHGRGRGPPRWR